MAIWKPIPGFPNYEASSEGLLRRVVQTSPFHPLREITGARNSNGYLRTSLIVDGKKVKRYVHQLVALTFHGAAPTSRHEVAHNDGDRSNNNASNLRWATRAENQADRILHGTHARGDRCSTSKLTWDQVEEIRGSSELQRVLACRFKVDQSQISRIRTGARGSWSAAV